jgi:hypothetical protein
MAMNFAVEMAFQLLAPRATENMTSGGVAPREVIEVAVNPTGLLSASTVVMTETPEA